MTDEPELQPLGLERVRVGELLPDDSRRVRIEGVVVDHGQLRMVPPQVVFTVRDGSGALRVRLAERKLFSIGTRLELIGSYHQVTESEMGTPGAAIFDVERYFELPAGTPSISGAAWLP